MSKESTETTVGGLPLYRTSLSRTELALKGGKGFWDDAKRIIDQSTLGGQVDVIMGGKAAPRVWAFIAESGQSAVAVAAALNCATVLAERGQSVILIDGDDHHPDLTRWAGRFELEGWIDLVRYGASLMTCSIPMELPGRKSLMIGVGSFCPTQVTEQEIDELLGRLRRRADDILVIIPAGEQGQPWAARAQIRLLGWDQSSRSAKAAQEAIDWLGDRGIELTGLIGFGSEADDAVAARLRPVGDTATVDPGRPTVAKTTPESTGTAAVTSDPDLAQATEKTVEAVEAAATAESAGRDATAAATAPAGTSETADASDADGKSKDFWSARDTSRRTSGVFWWLTAAFVVCALAAGIYYVKFMDHESTPRRGAMVPESVVSAPTASVGDELAAGDELSVGDELAGGDELSAGDELAGGSDLVGGDELADGNEPSAGAESADGDELPGGQVVGSGESSGGDMPGEPAAAGTVDTPQPYQVPVGQGGWALHLYSFPDNDLAQAQVTDLERRGYRAAMRAVDLPDKGRWYRVYVGSFASRNEALAARSDLLERIGTDWAMPFRF